MREGDVGGRREAGTRGPDDEAAPAPDDGTIPGESSWLSDSEQEHHSLNLPLPWAHSSPAVTYVAIQSTHSELPVRSDLRHPESTASNPCTAPILDDRRTIRRRPGFPRWASPTCLPNHPPSVVQAGGRADDTPARPARRVLGPCLGREAIPRCRGPYACVDAGCRSD